MKYAHLENKTNKLLGWYSSEIHDEIPEPNVEVTDDIWQDAINNNYNYYNVTTKKFEFKDLRVKEEILIQEKELKIKEAKNYLKSTDFYMTIDKYESLTEEKRKELLTKRAEARELINSLSI